MAYRIFDHIRSWGFIGLLVWVLVDVAWGWDDSRTVRLYHGAVNWNEHLYGHWLWWEEALEFLAVVGIGAFAFGAGWLFGKFGKDPKPDELPKWLKWLIAQEKK